MKRTPLLFGFSLALALLRAPLTYAFTLETQDGLLLTVSPRGAVEFLLVQKRDVPLSGPGGWFVRDYGRAVDPPARIVPVDETWELGEGWSLVIGDGEPEGPQQGPEPRGRWVARVEQAEPGFGGQLRRRLEVKPFTTYTFTLKAKLEGVQGQMPVVYLFQLNRAGEVVTEPQTMQSPYLLSAAIGNRDWFPLTRTLTTAPTAQYLELVLTFTAGSGTAYFADLEVQEHAPGEWEPFRTKATLTAEDTISFDGIALHAQLRLQATLTAQADHFSLRGSVQDIALRDRAVTVAFVLPLAAEGWKWWDGLSRSRTIGAKGIYAHWRELGEGYLLSPYPVACLSRQGQGLALAVPLSWPTVCRLGHEQGRGFFVAYDFGLTADTKSPHRADFSFVLYRVDPDWGLRSAWQRYYTLFPEDFTRRVQRFGAWFAGADPELLTDPEDFGLCFDEHSSRHLDWAREHQFYALEHLMPWGQWLPPPSVEVSPAAPEEEWEREAGPEFYPVFVRPPEARTREIIARGQLYDAEGKPYELVWRSKEGPDAVWTFLPWQLDPDLPSPNPAHYLYQRWPWPALPWSTAPTKSLDGIYLDALAEPWSGWHLENYRREHFAGADYPLTYSRRTRRPVQLAAWGHYEFLRWLHAQGPVLMGNLPPNTALTFLVPLLDVVGVGEGTLPEEEDLELLRALAYHKPLTFLAADLLDPQRPRFAVEALLKRCLLWDVFPGAAGWVDSSAWEPLRPLFKRYVPLLQALAEVGWEPVPFVRSSDANVAVERYGRGLDLFLILRNRAREPRATTLTIDVPALGLKGQEPTFLDLLSGNYLVARREPPSWTLDLLLPPEETRVISKLKVPAALLGIELEEE
ncbi:MAG TPA: hypothetical protein EYP85_04040 [Armatimonadetes bacterium]|nr:hypothetical protein [Armatimonadota bacterium]